MPITRDELKSAITNAITQRRALDGKGGVLRSIPLPSAVLSPLRDLIDDRTPTSVSGTDEDHPANKTLEFLNDCTAVQSGQIPPVTIPADLLRETILEHMAPTAADGLPNPETRVLYIRNATIVGDLDLSGLTILGSVKLVSCWIEGMIRMVHCAFQSCELSGSILHGFEASYAKVSGSIRARRAMFLGLVDLGAAHIGGVLDMMDSIILPVYLSSTSGIRVPQRGVLNLALTSIEHDLRLNRAQIFGNLMMDGARFGNCLFVENLLVMSISNAEVVFQFTEDLSNKSNSQNSAEVPTPETDFTLDNLRNNCEWHHYLWRMNNLTCAIVDKRKTNSAGRSDEWAKEWKHCLIELRSHRWAACLGWIKELNNQSHERSLFKLLRNNKDLNRDKAVSALGVTVGGTVIGRGATIMGSLDFSHSKIEGGITLEETTICGIPAETSSDLPRKYSPSKIELHHIESSRGDIKIKGFSQDDLRSRNRTKDFSGCRGKCWAYLDMSESNIAGSISIAGFSFMSPSSMTKEELGTPTILMSYLRAGGSISIQDTCGLNGIKAPGVRTGGSFRLMRQPSFDRKRDEYDRFVPEHACVSGKIGLSDAQIGRDCVLVFDRKTGPTLDLTGISVEGRLAILPAVAREVSEIRSEARSLEQCRPLQRRRYPNWLLWWASTKLRAGWEDWLFRKAPAAAQTEASFDCDHATRQILRLIAAEERIIREGVEARMQGREYRREAEHGAQANELLERWFGNETASGQTQLSGNPRIQLRSASAGMLVHPPAAWPRYGEMRLEGFQYSLVDSMGPLAPIRRRLESHSKITASSSFLKIIIQAITGVAAAYIAASHFSLASPSGLFPFIEVMYNVFGRTVTTLTLLLALFFAAWLFSHLVFPNSRLGMPLALTWLRLQGGRPSVYRTVGWYGSLGSYLQAAKVLRSAGRRNSAAETEYARLKQRERMLSWRGHWPVKLLSRVVDLISGYGFRPARSFFVFSVLILSGGALANQVHACGGTTPLLADSWRPDPILNGGSATLIPNGPSPRQASKYPLNEGRFSGLGYALDRYIPGYSGGEVDRWSLGVRWVQISNEQHCLHNALTNKWLDLKDNNQVELTILERTLTELSVTNNRIYQDVITNRTNHLQILNQAMEYLELILVGFLAVIALSITARVESLLTRPEES